MNETVVFPELLHGRDDDDASGPWTVREGSTLRGSASCNVAERILEVPLTRGAQARVVRAHELMHARVSPHAVHLMKALDEVSPRALECAEEFRVNTLLARLGFDVSLLKDDSEKLGARRLAQSNEWPEAVCFLAAVLDTGAEREYFSGIRQGRASWLPALRAIAKRAKAIFSQSTGVLSSTRLNDDGLPSGYAASTLVLARTLTQSMVAKVPEGPDELRAFRRSLDVGARRPPTGSFATLVFDESLERVVRHASSLRETRPATTGTTMRYPGRLVTDEFRRAFVQRRSCRGGVVIIDQSGSMDLDPEYLSSLLSQAPDALVIGYSHRPGDRGATPNAWILCARGEVATSYPAGNVGNGVDGPVLKWALQHRRAREPVVWVTDGQVTDAHDHSSRELTLECAALVRGHRIRLVRTLEDARRALRSTYDPSSVNLAAFGRLGQVLRPSTVK